MEQTGRCNYSKQTKFGIAGSLIVVLAVVIILAVVLTTNSSTEEVLCEVKVKTSNAINNNAIGGVVVTLLQHDTTVNQVTTDSVGQGHIYSPSGQVVLKAELEGFTMAPVTITVGEEECEKTIKLSLSPETSEPARVVMNWEHLPNDLDLHVKQLKGGSEVCHCYYENKECDGFALDVDNMDNGEKGAETITWSEIDQSSQYLVFVHDYSGGDTTHISESGARVALYRQGHDPITYNVPASGSRNRYWKVGCFTSNGFTPINQIVENMPINCPIGADQVSQSADLTSSATHISPQLFSRIIFTLTILSIFMFTSCNICNTHIYP